MNTMNCLSMTISHQGSTKEGVRATSTFILMILHRISTVAPLGVDILSICSLIKNTISELSCLFYNSLIAYHDNCTFSYNRCLSSNYDLGRDGAPLFLFFIYDIDDDDDEDGVTMQDYIYDQQGERRRYFVDENRQCGREGLFQQFYNMK